MLEYFQQQEEPVTRKTLREDIATLQESNFDIVTQRGKQNQYYLAKRQFEPGELKILCDMVASNQFLSLKQSKELIRKITLCSSRFQQQAIRKQVFHANRIMLDSRGNHLSNIEVITTAIQQRKKIAFQYSDYSNDKKKVLRHGGNEYYVSPYALVWENTRYYLIGHNDARNKIVLFRMDRIRHARLLPLDAVPRPRDFHVAKYTEQMFKMFSGDLTTVTLECHESVMNSMIDHFGESVKTTPVTNDIFRAEISVCLSPTFFSWLFQFGNKVRILSPDSAIECYREMLIQAMPDSSQVL